MSTSRCFGCPGWASCSSPSFCGEAIECLVSIADLAADQANAVDQGGDVSAGGLGRAVGDGDRLWRRMSRACAASRRRMRLRLRMAAIEPWRTRLAPVRGGDELPELEQPGRFHVGAQVEEGREVAPQLLTHAIGETGAFGAELGNARPFAQLDDDRIGGAETAEAMRIGAQGRRHDQAVAAVVLAPAGL